MKVFTVKRTRLITETFNVTADDEEEAVDILSYNDTVPDDEDCILSSMETITSDIEFVNEENL